MIDQEIWKDIEGFDHHYQVSNKGRVKRLEQRILFKDGRNPLYKELLFTPHKSKVRKGKEKIRLSVYCVLNGKPKTCYIARLVAKAFIPNPNNLPEVNHIDGDTENNNDWNLEWSSSSDNIIHAHVNNLIHKAIGVNNGKSKINSEEAVAIYNMHGTKKEIAECFSIAPSTVAAIKSGITWSHATGAIKNNKNLITCQR
jgi:hypothetical protein